MNGSHALCCGSVSHCCCPMPINTKPQGFAIAIQLLPTPLLVPRSPPWPSSFATSFHTPLGLTWWATSKMATSFLTPIPLRTSASMTIFGQMTLLATTGTEWRRTRASCRCVMPCSTCCWTPTPPTWVAASPRSSSHPSDPSNPSVVQDLAHRKWSHHSKSYAPFNGQHKCCERGVFP